MKNLTVFVSSSDSYSDLWPIFFELFKKFWPEYNGEIVLNTEEKEYAHEGLNIRCTKVGHLGSFGKVFRAGIDMLTTDAVLLIMVDYLFMARVNNEKVEEYYRYFNENKLDSLSLVNQGYQNVGPTDHNELLNVVPPAPNKMFSFQIAIWRKSILKEMVLPHESPWMAEWFGSKRAEKMHIKLVCPKAGDNNPIEYDLRGCLHQGKWLSNAVELLNSLGYKIDFEKRGYYVDGYNSLKFRVKLKLNIWKTGLMGSYWDLMKR